MARAAQPKGQPADQAVAVAQAKTVARQNDFVQELQAYSQNFGDALPPEIPIQHFVRVVVTAVSTNPDLLYANRRTLYTACMKAAVDGLLPDGREGALVVYSNTRVKQRDPETGLDKEVRIDVVQWMPMIYGIRKRMRNSGEVLNARAEAVYRNDKFQYRLGDDEFIQHEPPPLGDDRGEVIGSYAIIRLANGEVIRDVLNKKEIEAARAVSRAKEGPMWTNFYWEAAKKVALRRASKQAPTSPSLQRLLYRDEEPIGEISHEAPAERGDPEPQRENRAVAPEPEDTRPQFAVVDTDGVESIYGSAYRARDALLAILEEAAKAGLPALDGMWESNGALIDMLGAHGAGDVAAELASKYAELADALKAKAAKPAETTPAENPGRSGPSSTHAEDEGRVRAQPADRGPPANDANEPPAQEDDGWPGPRVEAQGAPQTREGGGRTDLPAKPSQAHGAPAPEEPAGSKHESLEIPVPQRHGKPDYRTWAVALLIPKIRRTRDPNMLAFLIGDNDAMLQEAKGHLTPADFADVERAKEEQWRAIEQQPA